MDLSKLNEVFQRYEGEEGALIPILQDIQDIFGEDIDIYRAVDSITKVLRPK